LPQGGEKGIVIIMLFAFLVNKKAVIKGAYDRADLLALTQTK